MSGYLRRLASTGAAYTAASVISKLIAVALLPLYTRFLTPADYGAAEVMFAAVVAFSIVIRLGVIEALLRFYYLEGEDRREVTGTSFALLFWAGLATVAVLMPFAGPISELLLGVEETELARIALVGLFVLTLSEYLLTLFRLDEKATQFLVVTMASVLVTIPVTVVLVVFEGLGAEGLLLGSYGTGLVFVIGLIIWHRRKLTLLPDWTVLRRMLRFGFPTMPAELSLYSLNFIDRILVARFLGLAEAGLYSLAVKISQSVNVLVRGFQLAFPPLAYSITDDDEARQAYSVIVTWFAVLMALVVTAIWLLAPWVVRIFAAPDFFPAVEAVGPVAAGTALYAIYMVLLVVLGRTGRTEFNFPATLAGVAVNIVLNVLLLPPLGILGAGVALVCSYLVVLVLMFAFTQRLFPVPYEWGRLAKAVVAAGLVIAIGLTFTPDDGFGSLAIRILLILTLPGLMLVFDFFTPVEKRYLRMLARPREFVGRLKKDAAEGRDEDRGLSEVYEVEQMNEDMRN